MATEMGTIRMNDGPGIDKILVRRRGYVAVQQETQVFKFRPEIGVVWVVIRPDGSACRHAFKYAYTGDFPGDEFPTWERMSEDIKAWIDRKE